MNQHAKNEPFNSLVPIVLKPYIYDLLYFTPEKYNFLSYFSLEKFERHKRLRTAFLNILPFSKSYEAEAVPMMKV